MVFPGRYFLAQLMVNILKLFDLRKLVKFIIVSKFHGSG